ncbi:MAG: hypothetical protein ACOC6G_00720 [Thermoproteota archaeon]
MSLNHIDGTENWFDRHVKAEAEEDIFSYSDRLGNIVALGVIILVTFYFAAHQMWSTGFFTSEFGSTEMFLFYSSLLYELVLTGIKGFIGRKNFARFFEIFGSILSTIALIWLYTIFPFDFTYFADVLPGFLRFLVQWVSSDLARVVMILGIIVMPITALYNAVLYIFVRKELCSETENS